MCNYFETNFLAIIGIVISLLGLAASGFAWKYAYKSNKYSKTIMDMILEDTTTIINSLEIPELEIAISKTSAKELNNEDKKTIRKYDKINNQPINAEEWFLKGVALGNNQEHDKSIECYKKAILNKNDFSEAYYNLGNIYLKQQEFDKAIECYKMAIKYKPDDEEAYNNMGVAYTDGRHDHSTAIKCYKKAIKLNPDYPITYYNMGFYYDVYEQNYRKAIKCYKKAVKLKPDYYDAYANMGIVFRKKKQYDKAIKCYEKAIGFNHDKAAVYYNMGNVYSDKGHKNIEKIYKKKAEKLGFKPENYDL